MRKGTNKTKIRVVTGILLMMFLMQNTVVFANSITEYSIEPQTDVLTVKGVLDNQVPNALVNFWLRRDGEIVCVKQGRTNADGEYQFDVNLSEITSTGGIFSIRTISQIEGADPKEIEYYSATEVEPIISDIVLQKDNDAYVAGKLVEKKSQITFKNPKLKDLIEGGKAGEVAIMLSSESDLTAGNFYEKVDKIAAVMTVAYTDDTDELESYISGKESLLGIQDNAIYQLFKSGIDDEGVLFTKFVENIINSEQTYTSCADFVTKMEDTAVITEMQNSRGTGALSNIITTKYPTKFNLTTFNNTGNNKDAVLSQIAVAIENGTITQLSQVQSVLDANIPTATPTPNPTPSSFGGGGGGISVSPPAPPKPDFDISELVEPIVPDFKDLGNHQWAADSVNALARLGMINGYSKNEFAPADNITRAQYCKMICSIFSLTDSKATIKFSDVANDAWYYQSVATLYAKGYINGVNESAFAPDAYISRQDAFTILYRVLADKKVFEAESTDASFKDWDAVSDYAKTAISTLAEYGFVAGDNGNVLPHNNMTRAEGAVLLHRVYEEVVQ